MLTNQLILQLPTVADAFCMCQPHKIWDGGKEQGIKLYLHYALSTISFSDFDNSLYCSLSAHCLYSCSILPNILWFPDEVAGECWSCFLISSRHYFCFSMDERRLKTSSWCGKIGRKYWFWHRKGEEPGLHFGFCWRIFNLFFKLQVNVCMRE